MVEKITRKLYNNLINRIGYIRKYEIPEVISRIAIARSNGDYSENDELHTEVKKKKALEFELTRNISVIGNHDILSYESIEDKSIVSLGCCVTIRSIRDKVLKIYILVGMAETDIKNGKIYYKSNFSSSLMNKRVNEVVEIVGESYLIDNIDYEYLKN